MPPLWAADCDLRSSSRAVFAAPRLLDVARFLAFRRLGGQPLSARHTNPETASLGVRTDLTASIAMCVFASASNPLVVRDFARLVV